MNLNLSMQQIPTSVATGTMPSKDPITIFKPVSLFTYLTLNNKLINNFSF